MQSSDGAHRSRLPIQVSLAVLPSHAAVLCVCRASPAPLLEGADAPLHIERRDTVPPLLPPLSLLHSQEPSRTCARSQYLLWFTGYHMWLPDSDFSRSLQKMRCDRQASNEASRQAKIADMTLLTISMSLMRAQISATRQRISLQCIATVCEWTNDLVLQ